MCSNTGPGDLCLSDACMWSPCERQICSQLNPTPWRYLGTRQCELCETVLFVNRSVVCWLFFNFIHFCFVSNPHIQIHIMFKRKILLIWISCYRLRENYGRLPIISVSFIWSIFSLPGMVNPSWTHLSCIVDGNGDCIYQVNMHPSIQHILSIHTNKKFSERAIASIKIWFGRKRSRCFSIVTHSLDDN